MNQPTEQTVRDCFLFLAALVLIGLGFASAFEGSAAGFIAGMGTALAIEVRFFWRALSR